MLKQRETGYTIKYPKKEIITQIRQLAADMARAKNMPSEYIEDWKLKGISHRNEILIIDKAETATKQSKEWAAILHNIAMMIDVMEDFPCLNK